MNQRVNGALDIDGAPRARIKISPGSNRLSLLVQMVEEEPGPDLRMRANLGYGLSFESDAAWHCLDVAVDRNVSEVYPVLCAIADKVQLDGTSFAGAVESVLSGLSDILAGRKGLSLEEQIGLFGELVVLLSLAKHLGVSDAVTAWTGPKGEEHDFGLPETDLEVKTTMTEHRRHWISGLTQLTPTGDRSLHLLSLQITSAGLGGGVSLAELVETIRSLPDMPAGRIDELLDRAGWRDWYGGLYDDRWQLRTPAETYVVNDEFPALTASRIGAVMPDIGRLVELRYRIDLDGLDTVSSLFPVLVVADSMVEEESGQ
ncbi:PD-(D/E)XK motif protein [Kribbella sp. CA-293567]|uniref:PD-(D/E)XK motif protein n=1 Tax=Kribbella sp. CA-293567 TaxID=3002436 RepID=UPI0022DD3FEC|nr:PD-(D/E)XK motif protein [Kribbella sp. CA-293567]WBQ07813.1 PD-(D/E)XK motif protein [Kribbella sp. CA-293567]